MTRRVERIAAKVLGVNSQQRCRRQLDELVLLETGCVGSARAEHCGAGCQTLADLRLLCSLAGAATVNAVHIQVISSKGCSSKRSPPELPGGTSFLSVPLCGQEFGPGRVFYDNTYP